MVYAIGEVKMIHARDESSGDSDLGDYIPLHILQEIQESLSEIAHVPLLFTSWDGRPLTRTPVLNTFCYRFIKLSGVKRPCSECERYKESESGSNLAGESRHPEAHDCALGLCDVAVPIILKDKVLAYLVTSQLADSKASEEAARRVLLELGLSAEAADDYVRQFPHMDCASVKRIARAIAGVVTLVSTLASTYATNARLAVYDALTGIFNRTYLWTLLESKASLAGSRGKPFSLVFFDLDGFKEINDTYGHRAGDLALQVVARCLSKSVRPGDVATRFGGDEFVLVLDDADRSIAEMIALRIQEKIERLRVSHNGQVLNLAASFGVAYVSRGSRKTAEEMFLAADRALYRAKSKLKRIRRAA